MPIAYQFLPWVRRGLAVALDTEDTLGAGGALAARGSAGQRRSRRLGDGLEFADHRDYSAGDDVRFIDWPYYARMEKLLLRLFHEHSEGQITNRLDSSAPLAPGGQPAEFGAVDRRGMRPAARCGGYSVVVNPTPFALPGWDKSKPAIAAGVAYHEARVPLVEQALAAMRRYAMSVEAAGSLVVVTTPSGYANALAQAVDEAGHPAIAGTIAGDNTIFVAARDGISAQSLKDELSGYLLQGAA